MNRLWVRLSLVFLAVLVVMVFLPFLFFAAGGGAENFSSYPELAALMESEQFSVIQEEQRQRIMRGITIIMMIGAVLGTTIGVLFSRTLTRPLDNLKDAAQAIEKKSYHTRVAEVGTQELIALAHAFNSMSAQLAEAETLRQNLLADVAHELRHPIHVLRGNIEAMQDGIFPLNDDSLDRLLNQTTLLATLVNDLHELAQAEAQQLKLVQRPSSIARLLDQIVTSFRPTAVAQNLYLELELLGKLPELEVDPDRVRQIILNLLTNAVDHTPEGGSILVSAEQIDDFVKIKVKDTGMGIAPTDLPAVFDRFYRGDKSRRRDKGGTGLGLAIVKALVEAHGGMIHVTSAGAEKGTEFSISLPIQTKVGA
jgi:signal transduction histidine kinase